MLNNLRSQRARAARRGFTVVESLIAGVILAVFAAALSGTIAQCNQASQRAQDQRAAAQWLDTVLTRIDIIGPNRVAVEGPESGSLDERFAWTATITQGALYADLYRVEVRITYTTPGGRSAEVVGHTQLFDPPGQRKSTALWSDL